MSICVRINGKHRKLCIGSLDKYIKVQTRTIKAPQGTAVDYTETFTDVIELWAMLQTTRGEQLFNGINIEQAYTHIFYIRYIADTTFENWVEWEDNRYDIVDVEDLDERHEWIALKCKKTGDSSKSASEA